MPSNLTVPQGTTIVLDEKPPQAFANSLEVITINSFNDLIKYNVIEAKDAIKSFLSTAKQVTGLALTPSREAKPTIVGKKTVDLKRYGNFMLGVSGSSHSEAQTFWRIARDIDPSVLGTITPDTKFDSFKFKLPALHLYRFKDIVIESKAKLVIAPHIQHLRCAKLLIKKSGLLQVTGSALILRATSIQGIQ